MKSISYAALDIVLILALSHVLWNPRQPKAYGAKAQIITTDPANNPADTQERHHLALHNDAFYKSEIADDSFSSAPAHSKRQNSNGKALSIFRNYSNQSIISARIADHRLGEDVRTLESVSKNLASVHHPLIANVNFETIGDGRRREDTNLEAKLDAEILDRSVRKRISNIDLQTVLDNALVNEIFMGVRRPNRKGNMDSGRGWRGLGGDRVRALSPIREGCTVCRRVRSRRDIGGSDKTTQNYLSTNTRHAIDTAINNSVTSSSSSSQFEATTTMKALPDGNHSSEFTQEVADLMSTPSGAEPRDYISMTTDSHDDKTTAGNEGGDHTTTAEETTTNQRISDEDDMEDGGSCSDASDFGQHGITALAVSLGLVVLLVYVLGMVLVVPRLMQRRRIRALHCPHNRHKGPNWLELGPRPLTVDREPEGPITDSYLDLVGDDTSLTSGSEVGQDATQGDDSHNVSTFLLRRESQQKAEERITEGKREAHRGKFEITDTVIVTEL